MVEGAVQSLWNGLSNLATGGVGLEIGGGMLDLILLGVIGLGAIRGYMRGGVEQIGSLLGSVIGIWMGVRHASEGAAAFESFASVPSELEAPIGFLIVFGVVQVAVRGISMMTGHVIDLAGMASANRAAGGAFGAFKAALMASILLAVGGKIGIPDRQARIESKWFRPVQQTLPATWGVLRSVIPEVGRLSQVKQNVLQEIRVLGSLRRVDENGSMIPGGNQGVAVATKGKPFSSAKTVEKTQLQREQKRRERRLRVRQAGPGALTTMGGHVQQAIEGIEQWWGDQVENSR